MGFSIGYSEVNLPKLLIFILSLLRFTRKLIFIVFRSVGLGYLLEPDFSDPTRTEAFHYVQSASAVVIRELLPVVKFSELVDPPESCAVCLYEFNAGDEVRPLTNCRHIFHRSCVDRWIDCDQNTCPLCRTPFISDELRDSVKGRLWVASGAGDYSVESPEIGY